MKTLQVVFFALMLAPSIMMVAQPSTAKTPMEEFPLKDVRRGMICTALTTFEGQTVESFSLRLVGLAPREEIGGKYLILARMMNGMPVIAGMSGSPVYCNHKLLGAVSYSIGNFPMGKALAGITPHRRYAKPRRSGWIIHWRFHCG